MKRTSTIFLQLVIVLLGIITLFLLLWEPHLESRNVDATAFEIYFNDPFLAFVYIASISYFVALYQTFKVLGYVRQNRTFTEPTLKSLRIIKYCALAMIGFVVLAEIFMLMMVSDDRAGGIAMGVFVAFGSLVAAATASMFEVILSDAPVSKLKD